MGVKRADAVATRNRVLSHIKECGIVTARKIATDLSLDVDAVGVLLYTMYKDGLVEKSIHKSTVGKFNLYRIATSRKVTRR